MLLARGIAEGNEDAAAQGADNLMNYLESLYPESDDQRMGLQLLSSAEPNQRYSALALYNESIESECHADR